jgi:hypothetical protein
MKPSTETKRLLSAIVITALCISPSFSDVLISDFETTNPLTYAFSENGSTWNDPVQQFQSFTDGNVSGQEVLPIGTGSPTANGGAYRNGLTLDLSGTLSLELTARLLASNEASYIQVLLYDSDGTVNKYSFSSSNFNTTTFTTVRIDYSDFYSSGGNSESIAGLDLTAITSYAVQGNHWDTDGSGNALFNVQFDNLNASVIPEPRSILMITIASASLLIIRKRFLI